jgi:hypothetical protein
MFIHTMWSYIPLRKQELSVDNIAHRKCDTGKRQKFKIKVTSLCTKKRVSSCSYISSIKALTYLVQKIYSRLKFFKTRSKFKIKVTRSKVLVPKERSLYNASMSQVCKTNMIPSIKALTHLVQKI